jgi:hypothetical protein
MLTEPSERSQGEVRKTEAAHYRLIASGLQPATLIA